MKKLALIASFLLLAQTGNAATWEIDTTHSELEFTARHLKFAKVKGTFKVYSGTVVIDEKDITKSKVNVTIDVNSISTDNTDRDNHLKSPDFFDAAGFPKATFVSTKVEKKDQALVVTGDLTMRGVTKPVTFEIQMSPEFKDPGGNAHLAFQDGKFKINRQDFGLKWNKITEGVGVVSDEIELELNIELKNKK